MTRDTAAERDRRIKEYAFAVAAAAPPMTAEERARIVELLRPTAQRLSTGGAA